LKLKCHKPLSDLAFNFNLRHYDKYLFFVKATLLENIQSRLAYTKGQAGTSTRSVLITT